MYGSQQFAGPYGELEMMFILKKKKKIGSPAESLFSLSFYFLYWAELQPEGDRKKLEDGAMVLKEVAPLAELSGDQRGPWPLLAQRNLH